MRVPISIGAKIRTDLRNIGLNFMCILSGQTRCKKPWFLSPRIHRLQQNIPSATDALSITSLPRFKIYCSQLLRLQRLITNFKPLSGANWNLSVFISGRSLKVSARPSTKCLVTLFLLRILPNGSCNRRQTNTRFYWGCFECLRCTRAPVCRWCEPWRNCRLTQQKGCEPSALKKSDWYRLNSSLVWLNCLMKAENSWRKL